MRNHITKEEHGLRPKATLEELRKRCEEKPSSKSVYTVGGIAYTVVSHYTGEKDIDEVIGRLAAEQAYADLSFPKAQQS